MPSAAHVQKLLRIICDDSIQSMSNIPPHPSLLIHSPREYGSLVALRLSHEHSAPWCHEHAL
jgi:hypothetical protein